MRILAFKVSDVLSKVAAGNIDLKGCDDAIMNELKDFFVKFNNQEDARKRSWLCYDFNNKNHKVGSFFSKPILSNPKADARLKKTTIYLEIEKEDSKEIVKGEYNTNNNSVNIFLSNNLFYDGKINPASIKTTLIHELRHAADFAYNVTNLKRRKNPSNILDKTLRVNALKVAKDLVRQLGTKIDSMDRSEIVSQINENPLLHDIDPETKEGFYADVIDFVKTLLFADYVNTPTELKSWVGNIAHDIFNKLGTDWKSLNGSELGNLIFSSQYGKHIEGNNKKNFMLRVVQELNKLSKTAP